MDVSNSVIAHIEH